MSIQHIDLDDERFEDAPKALRDYAASLKKALTETAKERDDARGQLASRAVSDVLGDKGFKNPERVKRDLLSDGIDATDKAAVEKWLSENGDDYARAAATPAADPAEQSGIDPAQQKAYEQLSQQGGEMRSAADLSKWELAQSEITKDMRGEDVAAIYAKYGI